VSFFVSYGSMLNTSLHNEELALFQPHLVIAKFHPKPTFDHQEHFVFLLMMVPDEGALKLDHLHHLPVEFANDLGFPVLLRAAVFD
jgi:hypothetical protein